MTSPPQPPHRRPLVTVFGAASPPASLLPHAEAIGRGLVQAGCRVLTGGRTGVMEAVSRGARTAPDAFDGCIIALLPGLDASEANEWADIVIPTGIGLARNALVAAAGDAVIAVGGGSGTLSEVAYAWQFGKPIVALDVGEGWSAKLAGLQLDHRREDAILRASSAEEAVRLAVAAIGERRALAWDLAGPGPARAT